MQKSFSAFAFEIPKIKAHHKACFCFWFFEGFLFAKFWNFWRAVMHGNRLFLTSFGCLNIDTAENWNFRERSALWNIPPTFDSRLCSPNMQTKKYIAFVNCSHSFFVAKILSYTKRCMFEHFIVCSNHNSQKSTCRSPADFTVGPSKFFSSGGKTGDKRILKLWSNSPHHTSQKCTSNRKQDNFFQLQAVRAK